MSEMSEETRIIEGQLRHAVIPAFEDRRGEVCGQCGHMKARHVKGTSQKMYCIDCNCGEFQ
jgi:hypothetical protein